MPNKFFTSWATFLAQPSKNKSIWSSQYSSVYQICRVRSYSGSDFSDPSTSHGGKVAQTPKVGIFWDLENKPPNSVAPFQAATRLKKAAASIGVVRYMVAYANRHAFSYVPPRVRDQRNKRMVLNHLENEGLIKPVEPYICRVCGRKFYNNEKLLNHFKIHELEHRKRLRQIDSAKGKKRVALVGKYAMNMEKFERASREILTPKKEGYGLADELKRAGFWVQKVGDKPQAADAALRRDMVDMMDHRRIDCLVLVSDDSDFTGVLKEARERCLKTVVVGDHNDGVLKRNGDAWFSWKDILVGKAKKEGPSVVERWRDRDLLKRLEWTYKPETEKAALDSDINDECKDGVGDLGFMTDDGRLPHKDNHPWWELDQN